MGQFTSRRTCSVKHRQGTEAQLTCPVHGHGSAPVLLVPGGYPGARIATASRNTSVAVPGYEESTWQEAPDGDSAWVNPDGKPHRLNGPARCLQETEYTYYEDVPVARFHWAVNGRDASMEEVFGRYMEAMSDGIVPSTDALVLRDMINGRALAVDEKTLTISIGDQRRFDALVDDFARTFVTLDRAESREIRVGFFDSDGKDPSNEWDVEYVDGDWNRHRPFGKAIMTDDRETSMYWWKGQSVSAARVMGESLAEVSDGAFATDNYPALTYIMENCEVDRSGRIVMKAYPYHSWKDLVGPLLEKFLNPTPGERHHVRIVSDPGEGDQASHAWVRDGATDRTDGPARIDAGGNQTYAIAGQRMSKAHVVSRYILDRTGVSIDPSNTAALEAFADQSDFRVGDEEDEWRFLHNDNLESAATLARALHPDV